MKAAIYSRKSKYSEKGESIDNQINLCKEYIKNNFKDISDDNIAVYEDEGFSGKNTLRPKFQELLSDIRAKKIDILVCYRLDRISRNIADFSSLIQELDKLSVSFVSISEQFDTTTPMGRAMMMIASVFAQLERETIAERIKDNMMELAKTGRWLGGTCPIGFKSEAITYYDEEMKQRKMFKLIPVPEEMETVKLIFKMFLELKSSHAVSTYLVTNSFKGKNGGEFSRTTVEQIVKNLVYVKADETLFEYLESKGVTIAGKPDGKHGVLTYNKRLGGKKEKDMSEWIAAVGKHEGIISSKDWIEIQEIYEKKREKSSPREGTSRRALLSGLMICGKCGSGMGLTSKIKHEDGKVEYYYRCNLKNRAACRCSNRNVNGQKIEEEVINHLKNIDREALIANYKQAKKEIKDNSANIKEINKIKKQIEKNNTSIQGLIRKLALVDDAMIELIQAEVNSIKNENVELESRLKELVTSYDKVVETKNDIDILLDRLDNFNKFIDYVDDIETKRDLIASVVEHIVWDYDAEQNIEIDLIGSKRKAAPGLVNRRLRFGTGSRQNNAAST